jgi:propanol-preferring alcohol dehydrogenase
VRALRLTAWQHEAELAEVADPEPGPGEVVVRIGGAGACHSDLHLMHEFPPGVLPFEPPFTLGHENAGWIESVGAGVTGLDPGAPVAVYGAWGCGRCGRCLQGMENYCENRAEYRREGSGPFDGAWRRGSPFRARHSFRSRTLIRSSALPLTDAGAHAVSRDQRLARSPGPGIHCALVIGAGGLWPYWRSRSSPPSGQRPSSRSTNRPTPRGSRSVGAGTACRRRRRRAGDPGAHRRPGHGPGVDSVGVDATIAVAVAVARPPRT